MIKRALGIHQLRNELIVVAIFVFGFCPTTSSCQRQMQHNGILTSHEEALFRASAAGNTQEVSTLLDQRTDVNVREEEGETPLMYAAAEGRSEVVNVLLDRGASINAISDNGETALARAVGMSRYDTVDLLLQRGADIERSSAAGGTPLMVAAGQGDLKMMRLLLDRGAKVNASDNEGFTALACAVSREASPDAVQLLLSSGANASIKNRRGETPLMLAQRNRNEALVRLLDSK